MTIHAIKKMLVEAKSAIDFVSIDECGPGIPEPVGRFQRSEFPGHHIRSDQRVVAKAILGGLHHEYRLEKVAA